jgi:hypothetical protein
LAELGAELAEVCEFAFVVEEELVTHGGAPEKKARD